MPSNHAPGPDAATADAELHDLGVLFVHGIGEQERSSTLVTFGEPLYRWIDRWFKGLAQSWGPAGAEFAQYLEWSARHMPDWRKLDATGWEHMETLRQVVGHLRSTATSAAGLPPLDTLANDVAHGIFAARATLSDAQGRAEADRAPSHAHLDLHAIAVDGQVHASHWIVAESWWAQTFFEPSFRVLAHWLVTIIPWTLGAHFGTRVRRALHRARTSRTPAPRARALLDAVVNFALLVASLPIAVAAEMVVLVAVGVSIVPIPLFRQVLLALERVLARTLGDSLVLVSSPLQQAAIVSQVERDVAWLSARCRRVAVVAHSQGGAVAHRALRFNRPPQVKLLVTFGSGLRKLEELDERGRTDDGFFGPAYLTLGAMALIGWSAWSAFYFQAGWEPWSLASGLALFGFMLAFYLFRVHALDLDWFASIFEQQGLCWIDYYATADPVPNGSLQDHDPETTSPHSVPVCNERSFLRDHTAYWENVEEFVGPVVGCLTGLVAGPWNAMVGQPLGFYLPHAIRRRWRVGAMVVARWTVRAAIAALVYTRWEGWRAVGVFLHARALAWIDAVLPGAMSIPDVAVPSSTTWVHTLGAIAAVYVTGRVARIVWNRWNDLEHRRYFVRVPSTVVAGNRMTAAQEFNARAMVLAWAWTFFSLLLAVWLVAGWYSPALVGDWQFGVWSGGTAASAAGIAAVCLWLLGVNHAVARALAWGHARAGAQKHA